MKNQKEQKKKDKKIEEVDIEEKEKEERPKEEETAKESKSVEDAGEISTNPEAEQALKEAEERTPEEKQQMYEEAYGMGERRSAAKELQRKTPLVIRESLINFVIEQEMLLRIHDELKGKDGWLDTHPLVLTTKLMGEVGELADALLTNKSPAVIRREAADVGNIAMMIAHKSGKL